MVEKYIHELLFVYDCVILPDFGGFVTHRVSADIHPLTNKFFPPAKTVAFNVQLILNDGLLISHLCREENITSEEAAEVVKKFVKSIKESMNKTNIYIFPRLGRFFLNLHGLLEFEPDYSINLSSDSFGLNEIYCKPIDRNYSDMSKISTRIRPVAKRSLNEKNSVKERLTLNTEDGKSKRSLSLILVLPILLLVLSTFALLYMNKTGKSLASILPGMAERQDITGEIDKQESLYSEPVPKDPTTYSDPSDLAIAEPSVLETSPIGPDKEPDTDFHKKTFKTKNTPSVYSDRKTNNGNINSSLISEKTGKYYIIAGSFSVKKNALKLKNKIKKSGESSFIIASDDRSNFKVSINKYDNINNAIVEIEKFKPVFGEQIWVLAY